jgi:Mce-associated membrane protein
VKDLKNKPLAVAVVAIVAAAAFAGWAGFSWFSASRAEAVTYGTARDEALQSGRELVAQLSSLDYHQVDQGISRWLDASTGPLHDQLARTDDTTKKTLAGDATVATGKVLDAALSELDEHAGTAKLLASVEITVARDMVAPATKRNRFAAQLTRTEAGWKLSALDQIPVGGR